MNIIVTKDNVKIAEQDLVHKGEYNVNPLIFSFSEEYEGISKMAVFSTPLKVYETAIVSNSCIIPHEVLTQKGVLKIGVYGYTLDNGVVNKRYSPTPIQIPINDGSYIKDASDPQAENPTEFEEFMQQLEEDIDSINDDINVLGQSVEDLQENKQDKIDSGNKLPSDLVNDENQTNKFVTAEDKTNWNNKSDFSGDYNDLTNKPTIPSKTSDLVNDSGFINKEVNNLTNYELKTDTGHSISVSIDSSTYVVTIALKNSAGTTISSGTIDLPLESVVVNGRYDSTTKSLILVLDNGNEITIPIGDLISGLVPSDRTIAGVDLQDNITKSELQNALEFNTKQNVIDNSNKLSADLVNDSDTTNKFVTSAEKTTWNNKSDFTGNYNDLTNKPDLTIYEEKTNAQAKYEELQAENEQLLDQIPTAIAEGETINVQDSSNLPIKDFAMTGNATQADTPTPSTPQDIHVVTGDNTVKVVGKNLLDKNAFITTASSSINISEVNGEIVIKRLGGSTYTYPLELESNTQYTIQLNLKKAFTDGSMQFLYSDNTTTTIIDNASSLGLTTLTSTSGKTIVGIKFNIYGWSNEAKFNNIQIEKSTTATTYEPYTEQTQLLSLGDIELAKIGDYTDKIFHAVQGNSIYDSLDSTTKASLTSGSWYKQGNIGKVTFNGSESWTLRETNTSGKSRFYTFLANVLRAPNSSTIGNIMCNKLSAATLNQQYTLTPSIATGNATTDYYGDIIVYTDETSGYTAAQFKTWLGSNNLLVYYALATPTYTEITDATLIPQLENILAMHTNKNVTNAWIEPSGTNAQGGMVLVYRQDLQTRLDNLETAILSL